jgi:hypothetical protein
VNDPIPIDWVFIGRNTWATNIIGGVLVRVVQAGAAGGVCFVPGLQVVPPAKRNQSAFGPEDEPGYLQVAVLDYQDA